LQECLLTDRPIALLYDSGNVKFSEDARALLSRRVMLCSNPDDFRKTIQALVQDMEDDQQRSRNRDFLNRYCMMNDTLENLKQFSALFMH
jgi:hypothetical protein